MPNPNPSPATRFGAPNGNKSNGGKTSEQKRAEDAAAEKAALLGDIFVSSIMEKIKEGSDPLELMDAQALKLLKDVQDRAHGTPKQSVDNTSSDGSMTPTVIERTIVKPDAK